MFAVDGEGVFAGPLGHVAGLVPGLPLQACQGQRGGLQGGEGKEGGVEGGEGKEGGVEGGDIKGEGGVEGGHYE